MEIVDHLRKAKSYIQQRWVNIALISFVILLLVKKDLSIEFNMNNPVKNGAMEQLDKSGKEDRNAQKKAKMKLTDLFKTQKKEHATQAHIGESLNFFAPAGIPDLPSVSGNASPITGQISPEQVEAFVDRFSKVARNEMRKYGIPASIILSQALISSLAGEDRLALEANNYFALPCTPDWQGSTYKMDGRCYRKYETAWYSFRDNSLYAQSGKYGPVPRNLKGDFVVWAKSFSNTENGDHSQYAGLLAEVIKEFGLNKYDK